MPGNTTSTAARAALWAAGAPPGPDACPAPPMEIGMASRMLSGSPAAALRGTDDRCPAPAHNAPRAECGGGQPLVIRRAAFEDPVGSSQRSFPGPAG